MQVYKITPTAQYVGGCALVAANTSEEAVKEFCKDDYYAVEYKEYSCTCDIIINLYYKTDNPCVIFNTIHSSWRLNYIL